METSRHLAIDIVNKLAGPKHRQIDATAFDGFCLVDIGYDSLDVVELVITVEQELNDRGVTTDIDDDRWNHSSLVTDVVNDIETLLEGKDLQ